MENLPVKISPEGLEVANAYLVNLNVMDTAAYLNMPVSDVHNYLNKSEVKRYIDSVFLEQGYQNRFTLQRTLTELIDKKLEEAAESEVWTKKDLLDLLQFAHKIRMDELEAASKVDNKTASNQVNIQNNFGENYSSLIKKLIGIDQ